MGRSKRKSYLPAPFLQTISVAEERVGEDREYPFNLPWLFSEPFELRFTTPVTIFVGENGAGKSTLIEALAALSGYGEAGGGKGYRPLSEEHEGRTVSSGAALANAIRAGWLPKVTEGWFFRAETFFSVARYLDHVGSPNADYLSGSHGEGFMRVFSERMSGRGLYFMDEPESALSPQRQLELLRILKRIQDTEMAQVIMATHSPILMALPGARLLEISADGIQETQYKKTKTFEIYQQFTQNPEEFMAEVFSGEETIF